MSTPCISIIIITRNRPGILAGCLDHVAGLEPVPGCEVETIVVDSSTGEESWKLLDTKPGIRKFRIIDGKDNMPQARNLAIRHALGEVLAFLDDDSMAEKQWLRRVHGHYSLPDVGGVGGRIIDERFALVENPQEPVGRVGDDGSVYLNFTRRTRTPIEVEHFMGCNMSFRAEAVRKAGGFDPAFSGTNYNEETDLCVRIHKLGYRLVFDPEAVVNHLAAPRERTARGGFDRRLNYYASRNKVYFLLKNYPITWRRFRHEVLATVKWQIVLFFREPCWAGFTSILYRSFGLLAGAGAYLKGRLRGRRAPA